MTSRGNIRDAIKQAVAGKNRQLSWSITPPTGWEKEVEDGLTTFADPEGVGALQFSSVTKTSGDVTDAELVESIEDMDLADRPREIAVFGPFAGYTLTTEHADGQVGRYWFLRAGSLLLFATYFCAKQHVGQEAAAIKKALASLRLT